MKSILAFLLAFGLILGVASAAPKPGAPKGGDKKAPSKTGIAWKVAPPNVVIILDGKKVGEAGSLTFTETKPGKHAVKLTKGKDETEMDVTVRKGEVVDFTFEFTE